MKKKNAEKNTKKKFWKRKSFWIILIVIAAIGIISVAIRHNKGDHTENGHEIAEPADDASTAVQYYNGVVQAQDTVSLQKDNDRSVKDIYVSEGDTVKKGQKLYSYDTTDDQNSLDQAKLELSSAGTDIADYQNQIADLTNKKNASGDASERSDYDDQITDLQTQIRQSQLTQKTKQLDIDNLNQKIADATVISPIDGVIKSISLNQSSDDSSFMTILSAGTWQIEGTADEMNLSSLSQNMSVVIHSRVSDDTWKGTIAKIDTEPVKSDNSNGGDSEDSGNGEASRYHFYVVPEKSDGLLLGQHVYLEVTGENTSEQDQSSTFPESTAETGDDLS